MPPEGPREGHPLREPRKQGTSPPPVVPRPPEQDAAPPKKQAAVEKNHNHEAEPGIKEVRPLFTSRIQRKMLEAAPVPAAAPPAKKEEPPESGPSLDAEMGHLASIEKQPPAPSIHVHLQDTRVLYDDLFCLAKQLFSKDADYAAVDTKRIVSVVAEVIGAIAAGNEEIVELAITHILKDEQFYLFQHSVNVCILSVEIGFGLNYEMGRLVELGLAAFLHDIGMSQYEDVVQVARPLTPQELEEIKKHVEVGAEILKKIDLGLSDAILTAQREIHERIDGSGYPAGKKTLQDYARVIALADGFESMIHARPHRPKYSIMEAYKRIFDAKSKYDQVSIKALVDRIGFFPVGTWVQLNTKERAKVVRQNKKAPLRPIIRLEYGSDDHKLESHEIKEVNLVQYPTLHVKRCFLDEATDETAG